MEKLLISVEDVRNELDIDLQFSLGKKPQYVDKWIFRVQNTILNHIALYAYGGMARVNQLLQSESNVKVVQQAIIEQIDFLAHNNFLQADQIMNTSGGQTVEPVIAPLAHQMLLNAGLLYLGAEI